MKIAPSFAGHGRLAQPYPLSAPRAQRERRTANVGAVDACQCLLVPLREWDELLLRLLGATDDGVVRGARDNVLEVRRAVALRGGSQALRRMCEKRQRRCTLRSHQTR